MVPERYGQTDGQTDGQTRQHTMAIPRFALKSQSASRGKNGHAEMVLSIIIVNIWMQHMHVTCALQLYYIVSYDWSRYHLYEIAEIVLYKLFITDNYKPV